MLDPNLGNVVNPFAPSSFLATDRNRQGKVGVFRDSWNLSNFNLAR